MPQLRDGRRRALDRQHTQFGHVGMQRLRARVDHHRRGTGIRNLSVTMLDSE